MAPRRLARICRKHIRELLRATVSVTSVRTEKCQQLYIERVTHSRKAYHQSQLNYNCHSVLAETMITYFRIPHIVGERKRARIVLLNKKRKKNVLF